MRSTFVVGLLVLWCSVAQAQQSPVWRLSDRPVVTIGAADGDARYTLNNIAGVLVLRDGRIAVAEQRSRIRVYLPDGKHQSDWGRAGEGPGEYRFIRDVSHYRGDSLAVFDTNLRRITILDAKGAVGRSFILKLPHARRPGSYSEGSCCVYVGAFLDGSFVVATPASVPNTPGGPRFSQQAFFRAAADGSRLDSIGSWPSVLYAYDASAPNRIRDARLSPVLVHTMSGDRLVLGNGATWSIDVVTRQGPTVRRVGPIRANRPLIPVNRDVKRQIEANIRASARSAEALRRALDNFEKAGFPETLPAYRWLGADPGGHVWVFQPPALPGTNELSRFDIFDTNNRHIATMTVPRGRQPAALTADSVVFIERDAEGVEYVRVYAIERPRAR